MRLVIDLYDEVYNNMVVKNEYTEMDVIAVHNALMGAKRIPEGHGRLIDADAIKPIKAPIAPLTPEDTVHYEWVYMKSRIDKAPTIIEADEEDRRWE